MRRKGFLLIFLVAAGVMLPFSLMAAEWHVPGDYGSIQAAIDGVQPGDTVLVAEGTYPENINFNGKAITVKSTDPGDPAVVASTIIDGGGNGSVVTFNSGESDNSVLDGFTIQNGNAPSGGGIYCSSSPLLSNNIITNNVAVEAFPLRGVGGGGYCINSSPLLTNNTIAMNSAGEGGGICCDNLSTPTLTSNIIDGNSAAYDGGGLLCMESSPILIGNSVTNNSAGWGAGILCYDNSSLILRDNIISDNYAGGYGGGVSFNRSSAMLKNNCIINNSTGHLGGAGIRAVYSSLELANNTVAGNTANWPYSQGAGIYCYTSSLLASNSIIWGNEAADYHQIYYEGESSVDVTYSCVQDGWPGTGNIDDDPLFVTGPDGGEHYLSEPDTGDLIQIGLGRSRCVDAGSDTAESLELDQRTTRTDGVTDSGIVDMGYHYEPMPVCEANPVQANGPPYIVKRHDPCSPPSLKVNIDLETLCNCTCEDLAQYLYENPDALAGITIETGRCDGLQVAASEVVCEDPSVPTLQVRFDNYLELNKLFVAGENDATLNFYVNADCDNFGFSLPVTVNVKLIGPRRLPDPLPFDCELTECPEKSHKKPRKKRR